MRRSSTGPRGRRIRRHSEWMQPFQVTRNGGTAATRRQTRNGDSVPTRGVRLPAGRPRGWTTCGRWLWSCPRLRAFSHTCAAHLLGPLPTNDRVRCMSPSPWAVRGRRNHHVWHRADLTGDLLVIADSPSRMSRAPGAMWAMLEVADLRRSPITSSAWYGPKPTNSLCLAGAVGRRHCSVGHCPSPTEESLAAGIGAEGVDATRTAHTGDQHGHRRGRRLARHRRLVWSRVPG